MFIRVQPIYWFADVISRYWPISDISAYVFVYVYIHGTGFVISATVLQTLGYVLCVYTYIPLFDEFSLFWIILNFLPFFPFILSVWVYFILFYFNLSGIRSFVSAEHLTF